MDKVITLPCWQWVGGFLTASALLAAILLVWAQQWVYVPSSKDEKKERKDEEEKRQEQFRVSLGKGWVLFAIVLVFVGCAWAFWNCALQDQSSIGPCAIGCCMAGFFMTGLAIVHSLFIAVLGLLRLVELDRSGMDFAERRPWILALGSAASGCLLTALGLTGAIPNLEWEVLGLLLVIKWWVFGVLLVIAGVIYYVKRKRRSIIDERRRNLTTHSRTPGGRRNESMKKDDPTEVEDNLYERMVAEAAPELKSHRTSLIRGSLVVVVVVAALVVALLLNWERTLMTSLLTASSLYALCGGLFLVQGSLADHTTLAHMSMTMIDGNKRLFVELAKARQNAYAGVIFLVVAFSIQSGALLTFGG